MNNIEKLILLHGINKIGKAEYKSIENQRIASFYAKHSRPITELIISIEPTQEGTGTPTPDNVRNFVDRTSAKLFVSPSNSQSDAIVYNISWVEDGTIYGGTINLLTGEITKTHTIIRACEVASAITSISTRESDESTAFWYYYSDILSYADVYNSKCNMASLLDPTIPFANGNINQYSAYSAYPSSFAMRFSSSLVGTTKTTIMQYFENNPIYFYFKLKVEQVYSIDEYKINTLLGENKIWCDCGEIIKLTYLSN